MRFSDILTLFTAILYGAVAFVNLVILRKFQVSKGILLSTICLFIYGLVRVFNNSLELEDQVAMAFALLLAATAPIQAAGILSGYDALHPPGRPKAKRAPSGGREPHEVGERGGLVQHHAQLAPIA